jgi:hypothetical protein
MRIFELFGQLGQVHQHLRRCGRQGVSGGYVAFTFSTTGLPPSSFRSSLFSFSSS